MTDTAINTVPHEPCEAILDKDQYGYFVWVGKHVNGTVIGDEYATRRFDRKHRAVEHARAIVKKLAWHVPWANMQDRTNAPGRPHTPSELTA